MARTLAVSPRSTRKPSVAKSAPTIEQIQLRAYEIFLERSGAPGSEVEDWLQAERELVAVGSAKPRKTARTAKPKAA